MKMPLLFVTFFVFATTASTMTPFTAEAAEQRLGELDFNTLSKNFGKVTRGQKLTQTFTFRNFGKGPVVISALFTSCGCAVAELEKGKVYQPGETGRLLVTLDTTHYKGQLSKTVSVLTDEKSRSSRTLTLKANVSEEVTAEPPIVDFGDVAIGDLEEKRVVIKRVNMKEPLKVGSVDFDHEHLDVQQQEENGNTLLIVKLKNGVQAGFIRGTLLVGNNSKHLPQLPVPVRANILGSIASHPAYLEFGTVKNNGKVVQTLKMEGNQAFAVTDTRLQVHVNGKEVKDPEKYLEIEGHASGATKNKDLRVRLKNRGQAGSVHGRVVFETSDPVQKELAVEFYGFFRG